MANEQLFQERLERINKAINYEPVDRMPLIFMGSAAVPRQLGMTIADYVYKPETFIDPALDYIDSLGVDGMNTAPWFRPDAGLTSLWAQPYQDAGAGIGRRRVMAGRGKRDHDDR